MGPSELGQNLPPLRIVRRLPRAHRRHAAAEGLDVVARVAGVLGNVEITKKAVHGGNPTEVILDEAAKRIERLKPDGDEDED